jgi:hypothetical protein
MKVKFEKQKLEVGLSAELPLHYEGPEQKYTLADSLAHATPTHVSFEKSTLEFDFATTADLVRTPARDRCYRLVSAMPDSALSEVEEELGETYQHYLAIAEAERARHLLPAPREVTALIANHVKT